MAAHAGAELQHQGRGQLGHGEGGVARGVADRDPPLPGGLDVDVVEARGEEGDELQPRAGLQDLPGDYRLVQDCDLAVADAGGQLLQTNSRR